MAFECRPGVQGLGKFIGFGVLNLGFRVSGFRV